MLFYSPYILTAVAALLVTCHGLQPGSFDLSGSFGMAAGLKGHLGLPSFLKPFRRDHPVPGVEKGKKEEKKILEQGQSAIQDTEPPKVLVSLEDRLHKLEHVLVFSGKMRKVGEKLFASNGKRADVGSALGLCEEAGGTLPTPMNEEENKAILAIVQQYNQYAYLGIKESEAPGQFKYLNGMSVNYTMWHRYEPNGKGTEKCVQMSTDGSWYDIKCNLNLLVVCEF
ncbi:pulmonary surfactant-associated protein A isoform X2 [Calypte anna]|uniref:pulmonary surfactant-associated protein A isoform X2 n=1 Tax=Calypte anna TaxID=9244 RepID=UPI0011C4725A|nr:pulmonary surfactant-associated protein A isoform X2 [Calypte anna]